MLISASAISSKPEGQFSRQRGRPVAGQGTGTDADRMDVRKIRSLIPHQRQAVDVHARTMIGLDDHAAAARREYEMIETDRVPGIGNFLAGRREFQRHHADGENSRS